METGEVLEISATDPAFGTDLESWCRRTGNQLLRIIKGEVATYLAAAETADTNLFI